MSKGRNFKFNLPDEGLSIEAGHVAQVPLVLRSKVGAAQTGNLLEVYDTNAATEVLLYSLSAAGVPTMTAASAQNSIIGQRFTVTVPFLPAAINSLLWVCPAGRTARVLRISECHTALDATETLMIQRLQGTEAPASGDDLQTAVFDLNSTNNTPVHATLTATDANRVLAAGDRLAAEFGSAMDTYAGVVSIDLVYES